MFSMQSSRRAFFVMVAVGAVLCMSPSFGADAMTTEAIKLGYKKHAAQTQLHRWYAFYENPNVDIAHQLAILDSNIVLKSTLGEAVGHEAYVARVKQLPTTWQDAHFINAPDISIADDGSIQMDLEITYQNWGMLPDGAIRQASLAYKTELKPTAGSVLPQFTSIAIEQLDEKSGTEFKSAYGENRLLALVHYWLALIEDPARDPEPVRELLADNFSLNFSSGAVTDFDGFKAWLAGPASQVVASTHVLSNFSYTELEDGQFSLMVDFDWEGILPDGNEMTAKTRHSWLVQDNPKEAFAHIKTMDVEVLAPFALK